MSAKLVEFERIVDYGIDSRAPPCFAGKHVVFGQVVDGYPVIKAAEACGSGGGNTSFDVMIKDCGQVPKGSERGAAVAGARRAPSFRVYERGLCGGLWA